MLKRIFAVFLLCSLFPLQSLFAQDTVEAGLIVRSAPEGAEVVLKGDAVVAGVTPTFFRQGLVGEYRVEIKKHGYEKYSTKVVLDPSRQMEVSVSLSRKTGFKAALRSLVIPGWGQRYGDQNTKGVLFHLMAAGSVAAFLIADQDFNDKYDLFTEEEAAFDSVRAAGGSYQDMQRAHRELVQAQQRAYDAENTRRITIGVAAGVWALNLIDALFFFPDEGGTFSVKGLTVTPTADPGSVGLTLTHSF